MNKNAPFIYGSIFLLALVGVLEFLTLKKTGGIFCYPLDDTFIHMAVAKNAALHGNWGVSSNEWVSTSSSPFFTGALTVLYKLFGLSVYFPFILSMFGAMMIIVAMNRELNRHTQLFTRYKTLCIILTLFVGAIPSLAALGMEHTFQVAFSLFFVHACASVLMNKEEASFNQLLVAALWGACMVFTRYENAFVVAGACALLFLQKRFKAAFLVGIISALPIILFGFYAVSKGGLFIPNSIQIKVRGNYKQLMNGGFAMLEVAASISGLLVLSIMVILKKFRHLHDRSFWILCIFVLSGLMHSVFGGFGWFYRYEAYLIVLGTFHLLILLLEWYQSGQWKNYKQYMLFAAVALLFTFNLPLRGVNALRNFIRSTYNIYEQQYQMGLFLKKYYDKKTIAANDIGAISYLADLNTIDLWGLGNNEVTVARKGGYWNSAFLQSLVKKENAIIAVVYESWFNKELLDNWKKIGTWEVSYSFMLGDTKVTFYAIDPKEADALRNNLATFNNQLPKDIRVEIFE